MTGNTLHTWAMVLLTLGTFSLSFLQHQLMLTGTTSPQEQVNALQASGTAMSFATVALLLKAVSASAVPVFALLLVEGFCNTGSYRQYLTRMGAAALISEIPYDLAISGKFWEPHYQNPMLGMVVCLVLLYLYDRYEMNRFSNMLIKVLVTALALAWGWMLRIDDSTCLTLMVIVMWAFREKHSQRNVAGVAVSILCCIGSPFYLGLPLGLILVHFYNGERTEQENRLLRYGAYPVMLLIAGILFQYVL